MIQFNVLAKPEPKGSYRAINHPVTGRALLIPSGDDERKEALKLWTKMVRQAAAKLVPNPPAYVERPLIVTMTFILRRPRDHFRADGTLKSWAPTYVHVKPDGDKLERATMDALTGIIWDDDSRVAWVNRKKIYGPDNLAGLKIRIDPL